MPSETHKNLSQENIEQLLGKIKNVTDSKADVSALASKADVSALAGKADVSALNSKLDVSEKGANNGVAGLDSTGKVPDSQLPSVLKYTSQTLTEQQQAQVKDNLGLSGESQKINGGFVNNSNLLYLTEDGQAIQGFTGIQLPQNDGLSFDGGRVEEREVEGETGNYLVLTINDEPITGFEPILLPAMGGGGGGLTTITLSNIVKVSDIRNGADAIFGFTAVSSDDTDITVQWTVDGRQYESVTKQSGSSFSFNAKGKVRNSDESLVRAAITSESGAVLSRKWTVKSTAFDISFSQAMEPIMFYTANEDIYALINVEAAAGTINTVTVSVGQNHIDREVTGSVSPLSVRISRDWFQTGVNTITAVMTSNADSEQHTDIISYTVIWGYNASGPIVAFEKETISAVQYDVVSVNYFVYDPANETASCTIQVGSEEPRSIEATRIMKQFEYSASASGQTTLTLRCGQSYDTVVINVSSSEYTIGIVTGDNLVYNLDPTGHSNSDSDRDSFGEITETVIDPYTDEPTTIHHKILFDNDNYSTAAGRAAATFDWVNGGFQVDENGARAFVIKKGHRATLPRSLFQDNDTAGKTVDISFKVANSDTYNAVAIQDMNEGGTRGVILMANEGRIHSNSASGQLFRYCEESRIDFSINVESVGTQRVLTAWLDGIPSRVVPYTTNGALVQDDHNMVIGSDNCDVWIYSIRVYNSSLDMKSMIQNYIASGNTTQEKIDRAIVNNIYSGTKITPSALHDAVQDLTIITIEAERLSKNKSDPVPARVTITDKNSEMVLEPTTSFDEDNKPVDGTCFLVQGTSSAAYGRSSYNMDINFSKDPDKQKYAISEKSIPVDYLNIKVNVASSENANNICAVDWYNTFNPYQTEHKNVPGERDSVEGKPCAVFFTNTTEDTIWISSQQVQAHETILYAMGDLCNSKKNKNVFGQKNTVVQGVVDHPTKACVEVSGNDTAVQRFEENPPAYNSEREEWCTFNGYDDNGKAKYITHFEWRMDPSSENLNEVVTAWENAAKWVVSTIGDSAKFKREVGNYFAIQSLLFHYLAIEYFAAYDNISKNTFYSYDWDPAANNGQGGYLWNIKCAYDWDTILACDNDGKLFGDYGLDFRDTLNGREYFNAATNPIWNNIKEAYQTELSSMYVTLRSRNAWDKNSNIKKWDDYQARRPHAAMVMDAFIKYIYPYKTQISQDEGYDDNYLPRMNGSKTYQRRQFFTYQTEYMDGKYGFATKDNAIQFRTNYETGATFTVKAYAKTYVTIMVDNNIAGTQKVETGQEVEFSGVSTGNNTTLYVTPARLIQYIRPLNETHNSTFASAGAVKLMEVILGGDIIHGSWDAETTLNVASPILKELSIRNITNFSHSLNFTGNPELINLDTRNTQTGQVSIAPYSPIKSIQLNAVTGFLATHVKTKPNDPVPMVFTMESGENLETIVADDCDPVIMNSLPGYLTQAFNKNENITRSARITGVDWELTDSTLLRRLYRTRAIDTEGNVQSAPCVLTGRIRIARISQRQLTMFNNAWAPGLEIIPENPSAVVEEYVVHFLNYDGTPVLNRSGQPYTQYVEDGELALDPVPIEIDAPLRPMDERYTYEFNSWTGINRAVHEETNVYANYTPTERTFKVEWWSGTSGAGVKLYEMENVAYGADVTYPNGIPTYTEREQSDAYYLFNGWNRSTGYVTKNMVYSNEEGDNRVIATWLIGNLPQSKEDAALSEITLPQIYAVAKTGHASYWDPKEHFQFHLGHDFNFLNVEQETLVDIEHPLYFDKDTQLPVIYSGENGKSSIQLFNGSHRRFTIAVDYEFTSDSGSLFSCFEQSYGSQSHKGFYLQKMRSGSTNIIQFIWGDTTTTVGFGYQRGILVLRYNADINPLRLYVGFDGNVTGDTSAIRGYYEINVTSPSSNARNAAQVRTQSTTTNSYLTLGGIAGEDKYLDQIASRATGWIHWAKIWYEDLGANDTLTLAQMPRLLQQYEFTKMRYWDSPTSGRYVNAIFMSNSALPLIGQMNNTSKNAGGWRDSQRRQWLNGQYFKSLPYPVQAMICEARVLSGAGNGSTEIYASMDKIFLPAKAECAQPQNTLVYNNELTYDEDNNASTIAYFAPDVLNGIPVQYTRIKFNDQIIPDDVNFILSAQEPTSTIPEAVHDRKTIWINSTNGSYGYFYLGPDYVRKHMFGCGRYLVPAINTTVIAATQEDGDGKTGGMWALSTVWFERTPLATSNEHFGVIYENGNETFTYATNRHSFVPLFAI